MSKTQSPIYSKKHLGNQYFLDVTSTQDFYLAVQHTNHKTHDSIKDNTSEQAGEINKYQK